MKKINGYKTIYLKETNRLGKKHKHALRIVNDCNSPWNLGAICYGHFCLDLQNMKCKGGRYLIGEIAAHPKKGNFLATTPRCRVKGVCPPSPRTIGASCCWGGSAYEAGVHFVSMAAAVKYLKDYFNVRACPANTTYKQPWINKI
jgi:hypothetical protein